MLSVEARLPLRDFELALALDLPEGCLALAGPSGAGKTTLLRVIAGLARPPAGRVAVNGEVWTDTAAGVFVPPEERRCGYLFQDYALFPHLSVERNVAFGGAEGVPALLDRFGIAQLAGVRPGDLSGGERQRVALARALARKPKVLLLDEPLAALDAQTRAHVRGELRGHLRGAGLPTVVVTHDFADAAALADRIGVLVDGKLVQVGTATELVSSPATPFVAEFAGGNLLLGTAVPRGDGLTEVMLTDGTSLVSADAVVGPVGVVVQPWEISIARAAPTDSMQNHVGGEIASLVPVGNRVRVRVGPLTAEITASSAERLGLRVGAMVVAGFKATGARLVPGGTKSRWSAGS
jgi:molybdate transport system ATP-binding protein